MSPHRDDPECALRTSSSSRHDFDRHAVHTRAKPLYIHKSYFDVHPRPQTSPPPLDVHTFHKKHSRRPTEQDSGSAKVSDASFAFPTADLFPDPSSFLSGGDYSHRHPRPRTRTGPSSAKSRRHDNHVPPLRFSGTSSLEDPPPTPSDVSSIGGFPALNFPVFVAAPIAGVETLDALVDGMNGMAGASMEDLFSRSASSLRFGLPGHPSLYQPPLPTPPPGVVLGKGKGRRREKAVTSDEDDDIPIPKPRRLHPRHRHNLVPSFSRKASTSTITIDSTPSDNTIPPVTDYNDSAPLNTVQPMERPRTVIPSISEIIRNHAPHTLERKRPSSEHAPSYGHGNGSLLTAPEEDESEPEPLTPDEEAELISRSSMDSIEHEVRRTYNNQKNSQVTAPPRHGPRAPPLASCSSNTSDGSSVPLGRAATSDTYTCSSSTASAHASQQSFDPIQFSISPTSTSQAIAEYLRSARLTTLLKLTRYPHASLDHPLTVSLADMGDPNGFPLIVFLGLGCVRHIMGLYDEMADCLGLRLIAIDR